MVSLFDGVDDVAELLQFVNSTLTKRVVKKTKVKFLFNIDSVLSAIKLVLLNGLKSINTVVILLNDEQAFTKKTDPAN